MLCTPQFLFQWRVCIAAQRFTYCAERDRKPTARYHDAEMSRSSQETQFFSFYCYLRYNKFQSLLHRWAWPHSDLIKNSIYSVPPGRSRDPGGCCGSRTKGSACWWPPGYWRWEIAQFRCDSVRLRHEYKLCCWIFPLTGTSAFTSTLDNPSNIMNAHGGIQSSQIQRQQNRTLNLSETTFMTDGSSDA